ncbi:MAG: oligoendopeptidase F [Sphaerochaetaceae bacterium]|nr:oligoendopeptidase F [Sphaerochaetaceae bacterium]
MAQHTIPERKDVPVEDTWNLELLYKTEKQWEDDIERIRKESSKSESFRGTIGKSKENLLSAVRYITEVEKIAERVGQYAFLRHAADGSDNTNQRLKSIVTTVLTQFSASVSFIEPEILAIDTDTIESWLKGSEFDDYRIMLSKMLRAKDHVLSSEMEHLMALQSEVGSKAQETFSALTNVDFDFKTVKTADGEIPLSQSTFGLLMQNRDQNVRKEAYDKFYTVFESHKHTLASLYETSVKQDIFRAKIRKYDDARSMFLFPDNVPATVYDSLITSVNEALPSLHRYYEVRREQLGLDTLNHYDVYAPMIDSVKVSHTYEDAVDLIEKALAPLGEEYVGVLKKGLTEDRWVDRYENKGKRSGAFSSGIYSGVPYIMMNYHEDVLRDVFTLAHEGGHSMHSYYSARNNPFPSYDYTIFEAEVASTFNEQLLARYLLDNSDDREMKRFILSKQLEDTVATLFRQTMFAEYEHRIHTLGEQGEPLTIELMRSEYRKLLDRYFGPDVALTQMSDLEGLRIPHFYRAYYVYKYATGISAAIALSQKVLNGAQKEREDYLRFLSSGGSKYPIDSLKDAGVDMSSPEPVREALKTFDSLLDAFTSLS